MLLCSFEYIQCLTRKKAIYKLKNAEPVKCIVRQMINICHHLDFTYEKQENAAYVEDIG